MYHPDSTTPTSKYTLKQITPNLRVLTTGNGNSILFSFETAVAAHVQGKGFYKSNVFYNVTTSQHIARWLREENATPEKVVSVDPAFFDTL